MPWLTTNLLITNTLLQTTDHHLLKVILFISHLCVWVTNNCHPMFTAMPTVDCTRTCLRVQGYLKRILCDLMLTATPTVVCTRTLPRVQGYLKRLFYGLKRENDKRKHAARNHRNLPPRYCRKQGFSEFLKTTTIM
uniref:Uncharacterized protein n=1 Tax=Glossina austeni TaxID=7395 RepID=A0A1A9VSX9_GLOAU